MDNDVDVVVIGLGPGGEAAATKLARAGLDVVAVDKHLVGGECPYYGCVPTKMMVRAAQLLAEGRRVAGAAGEAELTPAWSPVAARVSQEATSGWDDKAAVDRLEEAGATFVRGHARLAGDRVVEVADATYTARTGVLLNTGTEPAAPPIDGLADTPYWTNRDAVRVTELPSSLVVIGGGAIGAELAQVFARFGVQVTVLESADHLLAVEEPEAGRLLTEIFTGQGIRVVTGANVTAVAYAEGRFTISANEETHSADKLLVATGRRPNLPDIGLDTVGLDPQALSVDTDNRMRAAEGLWAVGDITGKGGFTHVSMYQAGIAVRDILGQDGAEADYRAVPRVTYTDPEVGFVGITERQARERGLAVRVGLARAPASTRDWIHGAGSESLIKLVSDAERGVLVGATAVGPTGGEVLSMLTTAVHAAVPTHTLASMMYAYPTFHRGVETALDSLG